MNTVKCDKDVAHGVTSYVALFVLWNIIDNNEINSTLYKVISNL